MPGWFLQRSALGGEAGHDQPASWRCPFKTWRASSGGIQRWCNCGWWFPKRDVLVSGFMLTGCSKLWFSLELPFLWLKLSGLILIVLFTFKATGKLRRQSYRHFLCWISMAYPPRGLTITLQRWPNQTSTCRRWEPSFRKDILTGLLENTISQPKNHFFSPDQEKTDLKADDTGEIWEGQETAGAKEIW